MKAFSYLRVSGMGQVDGDGFDRQRAAIAARADTIGATIVREFRDEGVSGTVEDRPALADLFVSLNGVRTVIVERADRIARDLLTSEVILARFRAAGVQVIEAESGTDLSQNDPDNPTGTLIRQILAVIAQFEKTSIVAKLRKARRRQREATGRCEGRKPFGDRPGEAEVIERMRAMRRKPKGKDRMSYAEIAAALNADGGATRTGAPWHAETVRKILNRSKP
jgi:DNA invertase Pin-like site-specific DNA recombinase